MLTNAPGEPRLGSQLQPEIASADAIDLVMAFIRRSGLRPLLDALREHCEAGRRPADPDDDVHGLNRGAGARGAGALGADVRVSYDLATTRLHAKAWLFHRQSGVLDRVRRLVEPHPLGSGHRPRMERARFRGPQPCVLAKFGAVFDSYWEGGDFVPYARPSSTTS